MNNHHTIKHHEQMRSNAWRYSILHLGLCGVVLAGELTWNWLANRRGRPNLTDVVTVEIDAKSTLQVVGTNTLVASNVNLIRSERVWTIRKPF